VTAPEGTITVPAAAVRPYFLFFLDFFFAAFLAFFFAAMTSTPLKVG
jgi:hypothetical protein